MSVIASGVLAPWADSTRALGAHAQGVAQSVELEAILDRLPAKQRKLMARAAELSTAVVHALLEVVPAIDRTDLGLFAGVGASGAKLDELLRLVRVCAEGGALSYEKLGTDGLAACHPLFAFRIMNNFTLSHPAIAEGVRGANGAFFSRGAATTHALVEAAWAIHEAQCERAIVLGADAAEHALTVEELRREGHTIDTPSEAAAALLVATARDASAKAFIVDATSARLDPHVDMRSALSAIDLQSDTTIAIIADAGLRAEALASLRTKHVVDLVAVCGSLLAAGPIVGACLAVDRITQGHDARCAVLSVDWDGALSQKTFAAKGEA
jgi:hypothetical protein